MAAGPGSGELRIIVGVDGSAHSQDALRWAAHFAAIFGARLHAVSCWEYPSSYGWASIAPDWSPAHDMEKVLDDTVRAVFGDQPPADMQRQVVEGGACSAQSARALPSTHPAPYSLCTATRHRPRQDPSNPTRYRRGACALSPGVLMAQGR